VLSSRYRPGGSDRGAFSVTLGAAARSSSVKTSGKVILVLAAAGVIVLGTRWLGWWGGDPAKPRTAAAAKGGRGGSLPTAARVRTASTSLPEAARDDDPRGTLRLEGQVIDEADQPVGGARVAIDASPPIVVESEADGSFVFEGLIARDYRLEAAADAGYAGPAQLRLGPDAEPVTLRLRPGGVVEVVVTEAAGGAPIAGAEVELRSSLPWRAVTGADGRFELPAVAAGTWRVTASHGDRSAATSAPLTVDGIHPRAGVELVLAAGGVVRGLVRDPAGKPVAAAEVRVVVQGNIGWRARREAFTDGAGRFAITGLPRRAVDVVAWHPGGASAIVAVDLAAQREHEVALTLDVTGAIAGVVVDGAGAPIGDAQVIVEPEWTGGVADRAAWGVRGSQGAVTDQAGGFRFAGLPDGSYRVRAARPGATEAALWLAEGVVAQPGGAAVRIVVGADGRVVGKVAFADGTAPKAFTVSIGGTHPVPFASGDGSFALAAAGGSHTVTIGGPGFVEARVRDVAVAGDKDADLGTITVAPGRSVSGRVVDANGAPVPGATIAAGALLSGGGAELYIPDESIGARSTEADDAGRFSLDGFGNGAVTVVAGKRDVGRSASLRLPPGPNSAVLELVLQPTTGLAGRVTRGGAPVADTVVIANPIGAISSNFFVITGADGSFVLDALAPGPYVVYPMLGGGGGRPKDMYLRRVEVTLGVRAEVAIDVTPGPVTLAIHLAADDGAAVPMASVLAIQAAVDARTMEELRDGSRLPMTPDGGRAIPMYLRQAMGGDLELAGVHAGGHTVCVVPFPGPVDDPELLPMKCVPIEVTAAPTRQPLEVVVPAAWLVPPKTATPPK
jgi:hypothetical protein